MLALFFGGVVVCQAIGQPHKLRHQKMDWRRLRRALDEVMLSDWLVVA